MSLLSVMGAIFLFFGAYEFKTFLQRRQWPLVISSLDSVDMKIEGTANTEGVGFFIRPKFIHKYKYSYHGTPYSIEIPVYEMKEEAPQLRVNPENPAEAFEDNKTLLRPILVMVTGLILILISIKVTNGTE